MLNSFQKGIRCQLAKVVIALVASLTLFLGFSSPAMAGYDPFIGEIQAFGFNFCPEGWAPANGQLLPISQNQALFSLYFTTYGGNGQTTFALPDLRGRDLIGQVGQGQAPGMNPYQMGEKVDQSHEKVRYEAKQLKMETVPQPGALAISYCVALEGIYPSRP